MSIEQIIVLAVVQGITEFLPISSSGHLILIPALTGWPDQGQFTDVMVHLGTLGAILVYFWRDVWKLIGGGLLLLRGKMTDEGRLAIYIVLDTTQLILTDEAKRGVVSFCSVPLPVSNCFFTSNLN